MSQLQAHDHFWTRGCTGARDLILIAFRQGSFRTLFLTNYFAHENDVEKALATLLETKFLIQNNQQLISEDDSRASQMKIQFLKRNNEY